MTNIDEDLKDSAPQFQLDPNSSSTHHMKIKLLSDIQAELLRDEARI